jgi:hypothetical protein
MMLRKERGALAMSGREREMSERGNGRKGGREAEYRGAIG